MCKFRVKFNLYLHVLLFYKIVIATPLENLTMQVVNNAKYVQVANHAKYVQVSNN